MLSNLPMMLQTVNPKHCDRKSPTPVQAFRIPSLGTVDVPRFYDRRFPQGKDEFLRLHSYQAQRGPILQEGGKDYNGEKNCDHQSADPYTIASIQKAGNPQLDVKEVCNMTTVEIPESDYEHLRRTIAVLERRVNSLENRLEVDAQHPSAFPAINGLQDDIIRITQELFPGKIAIGVTNDPEYPTDAYTVVHAQAAGAINEIEDRRDQWHERVAQLSADCGLLRLSLDYQTNYDR